MATIYNYNPFDVSGRIDQIVWRMVFPDRQVQIDAEKALEGIPASAEENEWELLHCENPETFLELIQRDVSRARFKYERAQDSGLHGPDLEKLQGGLTALEAALRKAIDLNHELRVEASVLRENNNKCGSDLKLTNGSLSHDTAPEFLLYSVYDWALDQHGIEVQEWARPGSFRPRRERKHSTTLLNILDEAIAEFWEDYDPNQPSPNIAVTAWLREKFPAEVDSNLLSSKVIEAMCKIMKPEDI